MNNQKVWVEVAHGLRLQRPEGCSAEVYALMSECWAEAQRQRPSMDTLASRLRQLYEACTGEPAPAPQGHTSSYEVPVSARGSMSEYSLAQQTAALKRAEYSLADDRGVIGVQMQNPVFDARRISQTGSAIYDLGGTGGLGVASTTDDESDTVYDLGSSAEKGAALAAGRVDDIGSSGGQQLYDMDNEPSTPAGRRNTIYDRAEATRVPGAVSTDGGDGENGGAAVERSRTGTLRHKAPAASPSSAARVLNLAWDEPDKAGDGADAGDIYDNEGGAAAEGSGAARRGVTASDVGRRVAVQGYPCSGVLRYFGPHHERGTTRCGVELDKPLGKNNGTVGVSRRRHARNPMVRVISRSLTESMNGSAHFNFFYRIMRILNATRTVAC